MSERKQTVIGIIVMVMGNAFLFYRALELLCERMGL